MVYIKGALLLGLDHRIPCLERHLLEPDISENDSGLDHAADWALRQCHSPFNVLDFRHIASNHLDCHVLAPRFVCGILQILDQCCCFRLIYARAGEKKEMTSSPISHPTCYTAAQSPKASNQKVTGIWIELQRHWCSVHWDAAFRRAFEHHSSKWLVFLDDCSHSRFKVADLVRVRTKQTWQQRRLLGKVASAAHDLSNLSRSCLHHLWERESRD